MANGQGNPQLAFGAGNLYDGVGRLLLTVNPKKTRIQGNSVTRPLAVSYHFQIQMHLFLESARGLKGFSLAQESQSS